MREQTKVEIEKLYEIARNILTKDGEVKPIFFLIKESEKETFCQPVIIQGKYDKYVFSQVVMEIAEKVNADGVIFITEAWVVEGAADKKDELELVPPSQHPERKEVLMAQYMSSLGEYQILSGNILKDLINKPYIKESKWVDYTVTENRLLKPWKNKEQKTGGETDIDTERMGLDACEELNSVPLSKTIH